MTPLHNKILCEVKIKEEKSSVMVVDKDKKPHSHLEVSVLDFGPAVVGIKKGDKLVVFNVYPNQIFEYGGKKLVFINYEDSMCFIK